MDGKEKARYVAKFEKHVLKQKEWPEGTTLNEYLKSIESVKGKPEYVFKYINKEDGREMYAFISKKDNIFVGMEKGSEEIITGFKPDLKRYSDAIDYIKKYDPSATQIFP